MVRDFWDPIGNDGCDEERTAVFIARQDAWVVTLLQCLVKNGKRGENRKKVYRQIRENSADHNKVFDRKYRVASESLVLQ